MSNNNNIMGEYQYNCDSRTMLPKNNNLDLSSISAFWYMNEKDMIDSGRQETSILSDCTLSVFFLGDSLPSSEKLYSHTSFDLTVPSPSKKIYNLYSGCILRSEYFRNYIEKCKGFKEEPSLLSFSSSPLCTKLPKTKLLFELVEEAPGIKEAFDIFVDLICRFFDKSQICNFVNEFSSSCYKNRQNQRTTNGDYTLLRKTAEYCLSIKYLATKYSFPLILLLTTIIYDELNLDDTVRITTNPVGSHTSGNWYHRVLLQKSVAVLFIPDAIKEPQSLPECIQSFHVYSSFVPFFGKKILHPSKNQQLFSKKSSGNEKSTCGDYSLPGISTDYGRFGKYCCHSSSFCPFCQFFQYNQESSSSSTTLDGSVDTTLSDGYWLTRSLALKESAKRVLTNFCTFSANVDILKQKHISQDCYLPGENYVIDNVYVFKHGMVITEPERESTTTTTTNTPVHGNKILSRVISTCFSTEDLFSVKSEMVPNILDLTVQFGTFDVSDYNSSVYEKYAISLKIKITSTKTNSNTTTNVVITPTIYFERIYCSNCNNNNNIGSLFKPLRNVYILDFYETTQETNNSSSGQNTNRLMSTMYNVFANDEPEQGIRCSTISGFPDPNEFKKRYQSLLGDSCEIVGGCIKDSRLRQNNKNQMKSHREVSVDFTDYGILEDHGKDKKTEIHFVLSVTHQNFGKIETSPCHVNLVKIREIFQSNPEETILVSSLPSINLEKLSTPNCFRDKFINKFTKCLYSEQNDVTPVLTSRHKRGHSDPNLSSSSSSSSEDGSFEQEDDVIHNNNNNNGGNSDSNEMDYTFTENRLFGMTEMADDDVSSEPFLSLPKRKYHEFLIQSDMMWKTTNT